MLFGGLLHKTTAYTTVLLTAYTTVRLTAYTTVQLTVYTSVLPTAYTTVLRDDLQKRPADGLHKPSV